MQKQSAENEECLQSTTPNRIEFDYRFGHRITHHNYLWSSGFVEQKKDNLFINNSFPTRPKWGTAARFKHTRTLGKLTWNQLRECLEDV